MPMLFLASAFSLKCSILLLFRDSQCQVLLPSLTGTLPSWEGLVGLGPHQSLDHHSPFAILHKS